MSKRAKRPATKPEAPEGYVWTILHLANGESVEALVSVEDFGEKVTK